MDLSDDEMAKLHVRYMVGGRPPSHYRSVCIVSNFRVARRVAQIPAYAWHALEYFAIPLPQPRYRLWPRAGGVRVSDHEPDFETRLHELGYECHDESNNPAFRFFLAG